VTVQVVVEILSTFAEAIPMLSGTSYPTLNEAVPVYNYLFDYLEGFLGQCKEEAEGRARAKIIDDACDPANKTVLHRALEAAHAKLRTYYGNTWAEMYVIAVVLDPSYQMRYFKVNHWEEWEVDACKAAVQKTMQEYGAEEPQPDETGREACMGGIRAEIRNKLKGCQAGEQSELERYLSTPMVDGDMKILEWWRLHAKQYPCLARIARDYLAIPATSVPAERVFSSGANLITKKRGSLNKDTIRACISLGSWL
jgi:hypothetical protein